MFISTVMIIIIPSTAIIIGRGATVVKQSFGIKKGLSFLWNVNDIDQNAYLHTQQQIPKWSTNDL